METYIVLANVEHKDYLLFDRKALERYENFKFETIKKMTMTFDYNHMKVMTLTDFIDSFNDDEIYQGEIFITYVYVKG